MVDKETENLVRRIVDDELRKIGLDPDKPEETREVIRWTAKHMRSFENIGGWVAKSVVLALVALILLAIWEGVKHYVKTLGQ